MASQQDDPGFTFPQEVAYTVAPIISGLLSTLGSTAIIWMILTDWNRKIRRVKYRILLGLSLSDALSSIVQMFWGIMLPKGTPGSWGAIGNKATCSAHGFILQFGLSGSFYNTALSAYFYKSICFGMTDATFAAKYELWIHLTSVLFPLATAVGALILDIYSVTGGGCYIAPDPLRCHRRDDVECLRGENAYKYSWAVAGVPVVIFLLYITYTMFRIYQKVRQVSRRSERFEFRSTRVSYEMPNSENPSEEQRRQSVNGQDSNDNFSLRELDEQHGDTTELLRPPAVSFQLTGGNTGTSSGTASPPLTHPLPSASSRGRSSFNSRRSIQDSNRVSRIRETAIQAFLYVVAFFGTHFPSFILNNLEMFGGTSPFYLVFLASFAWPLQGFFNLFVFLRPRIRSCRRQEPSLSYCKAAYLALFHYDEARGRVNESQLTDATPDAAKFPSGSDSCNGSQALQMIRVSRLESIDDNDYREESLSSASAYEDETNNGPSTLDTVESYPASQVPDTATMADEESYSPDSFEASKEIKHVVSLLRTKEHPEENQDHDRN